MKRPIEEQDDRETNKPYDHGSGIQVPLKKKCSSLFSIPTVQEEESDGAENTCSIGLDLMAKEEAGSCETIHKAAFPLVIARNAPPPALFCTEESSCGDENSEAASLSAFGIKPPKKSPGQQPPIEMVQEVIIATESTATCVTKKDHNTGLVFEAGASHYDRHNRFHKERPLRITSIMEALKTSENDLWERCHVLGEQDTTQSATNFLEEEDYLRVHLPGYMKRLDRLFNNNCNCCNDERLDREAEQYKSIYFTKDSLHQAKRAASSLCSLVELVVKRSKSLDNGFAVIRPPGHHAEPGLAGGYCIINNVAVAAVYARAKLGVQKILIVDWDVHHGNGTQSIFLKDPNVLYFSAHRWHGGNFFPFLANGGPTNVGMGDGKGYNINVGWTIKGVGDEEYLALWQVLLLPVAREFQPELILVSAGFDAAEGDLGECNLTPNGYGRLTRSLMRLNVPIVCALEGGYVRSVLGRCVSSVVTALLDQDSSSKSQLEDAEDLRARGQEDVLNTINATAAKNIRATISAHKAYWTCHR